MRSSSVKIRLVLTIISNRSTGRETWCEIGCGSSCENGFAGPIDIVLMFDCPNMARFNELTEEVLTVDSTVRRYETHFIKRETKFEPFVQLAERG